MEKTLSVVFPLYFRIQADNEVDNEIDNFSLGNQKTIVYKQNAMKNGYSIVFELEHVLKSGYYEPAFG